MYYVIHGLLNLTWVGKLIALLVMTHITVLGVTIYLHRGQAHRALTVHPVLAHFFRFTLWLTTGMGTKAWVAIHRKHHATCETEEDPHSPQILGLRKVFFEGAELYRAEAKNQETLDKYGEGTPDDWIERNLYTKHSVAGLVIMFILNVSLFGLIGISMWAIQMLWIPFWAAGVINGIGHYWGYRNFECNDAATNIVPWGIIAGGEELHNNHHTFGSSAKFSVKWWEFDIGWMYICVFRTLGLVKVRRQIPKLMQNPMKSILDTDSVAAIVSNRFQVLDQYWKNVVMPVMRAEKMKVSKLLVKEPSIMDNKDRFQLEKMLSECATLQTIYDFKVQLQEIWSRSAFQKGEKLEKLSAWCAQAQASGIKALQDFAENLRHYTAQPVNT